MVGLRLDPSLTFRAREQTKMVVLHDSHTVPGKVNLEAWLKVNGRKLGLLEIGYHAIIFQDGRLLETRPHNVIGSHTTGYNEDSVGVVLEGGREVDELSPDHVALTPSDNFTEAQMEALCGYFQYLTSVYGSLSLKGHSELGHHRHRSTCPMVNMEKVRQRCQPQ